jgi:hypothetical protein
LEKHFKAGLFQPGINFIKTHNSVPLYFAIKIVVKGNLYPEREL